MSDINLLTCNSVVLKNPSSYDVNYSDLDGENSYVGETGHTVRDMIRANQVSIAVSWDRLTLSELSSLLTTCTGNSSYTLTYLDFRTGAFKTSTFRPDNRSGKAKKIRNISSGLYSLSFNFIEL